MLRSFSQKKGNGPLPRTWIQLLLINGLILFAGLALVELIFGSWVFNSPLDRLLVPRNEKVIYHQSLPDGSAWTSVYERDANGLRGPYRSLSDIDVLTIGGSTTDQRFLSEPDTWQGILRSAFAGIGQDITVVNAGLDGQSTVGHLAAFDLWFPHLPNLHPRYVLAYIGINDRYLSRDNAYDHMVPGKKTWKRIITDNSALYFLYRTIRGMIQAEAYDVAHGSQLTEQQWVPLASPVPPPPSVDEQRRLAAYRERVRQLSIRITGLGAIPIFVTQPQAAYTPRDGRIFGRKGIGPSHYYALRRFNDATMETCRQVKAICLDLAADVNFGVQDFYDRIHTTAAGSRKIGLYLFSRLRNVIQPTKSR